MSNGVRIGLTSLLLLASSLPAFAQAVGGTIEGSVTDTGSQPLADICVGVWDSLGQVAAGSSAVDGSYSLPVAVDGLYRVMAVDCTFFVYGERWWNDQRGLASADLVSVTGGSVVTGIDFALPELGSIAGTVTNESAQPLEDICVFGARVDGSGGLGTTTAADGSYLLLGLEPFDYTVEFSDCIGNLLDTEWWNGATDEAAADAVVVGEGTATTGIDAALAPPEAPGLVNGAVADDLSGLAIAGICVTAWDSGGNQVGSATTAADGTYSMVADPAGPLEGDYKIRFEDCLNGFYATVWHSAPQYDPFGSSVLALPVHVVKGETTEVFMRMLAPGRYQGSVVDEETGEPLAGICVLATIVDVVIAETTTNAGGDFIITLPQGAYFILVADCDDGSHNSRWNLDNSDAGFRILNIVTSGETVEFGTARMEPGESAFARLGPSTMLTTDTEDDGATADDPVEVTVWTIGPPGVATIDEEPAPSVVSGYRTLGNGVRLYLPTHMESDVTGGDLVGPLSAISFEVHESLMTQGEAPDILRNGELITPCPGEDAGFLGICVTGVEHLDNGNVDIRVVTTEGSDWHFTYAQAAEPGGISTIPLTGYPGNLGVSLLVVLGLIGLGGGLVWRRRMGDGGVVP